MSHSWNRLCDTLNHILFLYRVCPVDVLVDIVGWLIIGRDFILLVYSVVFVYRPLLHAGLVQGISSLHHQQTMTLRYLFMMILIMFVVENVESCVNSKS